MVVSSSLTKQFASESRDPMTSPSQDTIDSVTLSHIMSSSVHAQQELQPNVNDPTCLTQMSKSVIAGMPISHINLARNNVQLPTLHLSPYLNTYYLFIHGFPSFIQ